MTLFLGTFLVVGLWSGSGVPTWSAEEVRVRAWPHSGYGRLVFDWSAPVEYTAELTDRTLEVTFDRPIRPRFGQVEAYLSDYVEATEVSQDGRAMSFNLAGDYELRHFVLNGAVVLDLLTGPKQTTAATAVRVHAGEYQGYSRLVFDWKRTVDYVVDTNGDEVTVRFEHDAPLEAAALTRSPPKGILRAELREDAAGAALDMLVAPGSRVRHFRDGLRVIVDVFEPSAHEAAQVPESAVAADGPEVSTDEPDTGATAAGTDSELLVSPAGQAQGDGPNVPRAAPRDAVEISRLAVGAPRSLRPEPAEEEPTPTAESTGALPAETSDVGVRVVFPFSYSTAAAAFRRGGRLWLVFDRRSRIDEAELEAAGSGLIEEVELVRNGTATVFRVVVAAGSGPVMIREGNDWILVLQPRDEVARPPLLASVTDGTAGGSSVVLPVEGAGRPIELTDPEIGDRFWVVPLYGPGQGIPRRRDFIDFQLLASTQGIVVASLSDRIVVSTDPAGHVSVEVVGGGALSSNEERRRIETARARGFALPRILRFDDWRRPDLGGYEQARQALLTRIAEGGAVERNSVRLSLARLYFANGLVARALGVLDSIAQESPTLVRDPSYLALRGVGRFLMDDIDAAAEDLSHRAFNDEPEIALWRAAVSALREEWEVAATGFRQGLIYTSRYPEALRIQLGLLGAETALQVEDSKGAEAWLDSMRDLQISAEDAGRIEVMRARLTAVRGDIGRSGEG